MCALQKFHGHGRILLGLIPIVFSSLGCQQMTEVTYSQADVMTLDKGRLKMEIAKAERGDVEAMGKVYRHYAFGDFDEDQADFWLRRLAEAGHPASQFNLGKDLVEEGRITDGLEWIRKAESADFGPAVEYMAEIRKERGARQGTAD